MSLTAYEKETILNFNEEERTASIYTHNKRMIKRLEESCQKFPDIFKLESVDGEAYSFLVPKKYISVRTPKAKKEYTEEERQLLRERLSKARAN